MRHGLRRIWVGIKLGRDIVYPLLNGVLTGVGVIGTFLSFSPKPYWLIIILIALTILSIVWIIIPIFRILKLPYSEFWLSFKGARKWLKPKLEGYPSFLYKNKVRTVSIIGVACTDIAYLFDEIVESIGSGINFRVIMVNPDNQDVVESLRKWEHDQEVKEIIQQPMKEKLEELEKKYESLGKRNVVNEFLNARLSLELKQLTDHSECIRVCARIWQLAEEEARSRWPLTSGSVLICYLNELPYVRQWLLGDKALLYQLYIGNPGVGMDNPVFGYSTFDGRVDQFGEIIDRAAYFVEQLISKTKPSCTTVLDRSLDCFASGEPQEVTPEIFS